MRLFRCLALVFPQSGCAMDRATDRFQPKRAVLPPRGQSSAGLVFAQDQLHPPAGAGTRQGSSADAAPGGISCSNSGISQPFAAAGSRGRRSANAAAGNSARYNHPRDVEECQFVPAPHTSQPHRWADGGWAVDCGSNGGNCYFNSWHEALRMLHFTGDLALGGANGRPESLPRDGRSMHQGLVDWLRDRDSYNLRRKNEDEMRLYDVFSDYLIGIIEGTGMDLRLPDLPSSKTTGVARSTKFQADCSYGPARGSVAVSRSISEPVQMDADSKPYAGKPRAEGVLARTAVSKEQGMVLPSGSTPGSQTLGSDFCCCGPGGSPIAEDNSPEINLFGHKHRTGAAGVSSSSRSRSSSSLPESGARIAGFGGAASVALIPGEGAATDEEDEGDPLTPEDKLLVQRFLEKFQDPGSASMGSDQGHVFRNNAAVEQALATWWQVQLVHVGSGGQVKAEHEPLWLHSATSQPLPTVKIYDLGKHAQAAIPPKLEPSRGLS
ncbi:unnamed protein product [Amoebophrya sp. A120]|nr:unnamed protein product [Amoebophrya sp. A120]|eukprot:GSA120T00003490001.1